MKNRGFIFLLLTLFLVSCNDDKVEKYKDVIIGSKIKRSMTDIIGVDPFNTSMNLIYYFNEENYTDKKNSISSLYNSIISMNHVYFDRHYDYYDSNNNLINNLKTINDSFDTGNKIKCSDELYDLLKLSSSLYSLTEGYFNIFTGRVTDYWEDLFSYYNDDEEITTFDPEYDTFFREKLESIVAQVPNNIDDFNAQLTFYDDSKEVMFNKLSYQENNNHPLISLGGIGKGYATDLVEEVLIDNNYTDGLLYSGGSSISSLSAPTFIFEPDKGIKVGFTNPITKGLFSSEECFAIPFKNDFRCSTSGDYTFSKYYDLVNKDGETIRRYHIFSPFNGYPNANNHQVTCISNSLSSAVLDCLTTSLMASNKETGKTIINNFINYYNCDLAVYYVDKDINNNAKIIAINNIYTVEVASNASIEYEQ